MASVITFRPPLGWGNPGTLRLSLRNAGGGGCVSVRTRGNHRGSHRAIKAPGAVLFPCLFSNKKDLTQRKKKNRPIIYKRWGKVNFRGRACAVPLGQFPQKLRGRPVMKRENPGSGCAAGGVFSWRSARRFSSGNLIYIWFPMEFLNFMKSYINIYDYQVFGVIYG